MKKKIIKWLGGYTEKEYTRANKKFEALLDSKTDQKCTCVANEYVWMVFRDLERFAKNELYFQKTEEWARKMYNVIHNNYLRMLTRYIMNDSNVIYRVDTTLTEDNEFQNIMDNEGTVNISEDSILRFKTMWNNLYEKLINSLSDEECLSKKEFKQIMDSIDNEYKQ